MSTAAYVNSVLQPGEKVVLVTRLHWIIYGKAVLVLVLGSVLLIVEYAYGADDGVRAITAMLFGALSVLLFLAAWFDRWITEFAVTDKRVIYKMGFIYRRTAEMNMDKVESVDVNQSILGRILDYGTLHVCGAGQGIEHLHRVASPIKVRNAITAR
jgi:uncharacterized membrane protein YdbT with pleckstrin-like domain